jgi:2OG-Fe(II) oxygenase superfamily
VTSLLDDGKKLTMTQRGVTVSEDTWETYNYFDIYKSRFDRQECQKIIDLHHGSHLVRSKMSDAAGLTLRESDLFWIPRGTNTEWIFSRLWDLVILYNSKYGFELSDDIGQAQLTRYQSGQHYEWHMDLGPQRLSLRKITAVVELVSKDLIKGGGLEIFYGDAVENKIDLDIGDVALFPSFVMHRASIVESGARWSLVLWLNGVRPLK